MGDRGRPGRTDPLPESFDTLEDFWAFWDAHSTADYEAVMEAVEVEEVARTAKTYCAIDRELLGRVRAQARREGLSTEALIEAWLSEKVSAA